VESLLKGITIVNTRKRKLEEKNSILEKAILETGLNATDSAIDNLIEKSKSISTELSNAIAKRMKFSENNKDKTYHMGTEYSQEMKEFALSLHNISPAGYRYVREALDNILPAEATITRWMRKVDGSPGFSDQVYNYNIMLHRVNLGIFSQFQV